jgi:tetratricopeptide (TPR) repeat protein
VLTLLGPDADLRHNFERAAQEALAATTQATGRDLYFAWFNRGTNLVYLENYVGAAAAYDQAFAVYAGLGEEERPWRMLWYQAGPYAAYFHAGRYEDVISLAKATLTFVDKPVLEETYYWRGLAKEALGDLEGAIADLTRAADLNPHSTDAVEQLRRLGVERP